MARADSPLSRSIGLSGAIRWYIAVVATIAVGAAFVERHYALGTVGVVFLFGAVTLAYRAWRARSESGPTDPGR